VSPLVSNNYQSNGACSTTCNGYAFAVVQGKSCWCSNYAPGDTTSTGDCSVACPGYPYESCGNEASGLYGYVALGPSPFGTQGAASSSPKENTTPTQPTEPVVQPVSTQPLPGAFPGPTVPLAPALPFTSDTALTLQLSPSFQGAPTSMHVLTHSVHNFPPAPSPVTVRDTVTAQPSVKNSYVSIVCSSLLLMAATPLRSCMALPR
jgi:cell wall integrity and stress response component